MKTERVELVGKSDTDTRVKIARWLRPLVFPYDETQDRCVLVAIKHVSGTGRLADIQTLKVPGIMEDGGEIQYRAFVGDVEQIMLDDVEGTGGVQRYVLQALDADKKAFARLAVRYTATRNEAEMDGFDTEPVGVTGMLTQAMRHNEARERIDKAGWGTLINVQARTIEMLSEQVHKLSSRQMDFLEAMEEVMSKRHERELEIVREENKAKLKADIGRQVNALLPAVAKKFGVDIGDSQHPDVIQLRAFIASMSEEQLAAFQSALSPEQLIELLTIIKRQGEDGTEGDDTKLLAQARKGED